MLYDSAIQPATLVLLKQLMAIPELKDFGLVGGTALALRFGHRVSVDLDLFSTNDFKNEELIAILENNFDRFTYRNPNNTIGVFGFINDIKVDFVRHHHFKVIDAIHTEDSIRMFSDKDIIAMKINAILKRAVKKDFWDISELLKHYSVNDFVEYYYAKYPSQMLLISIPYALTSFEDAEESETPVSLKKQTWAKVKKEIQKKVSEYLT
jgi:predicted nucleotidyltransferase component of viral defense system